MKDIYWQVNGVNTRSKGEALLLSGGDLSAIHFYFHDNEWKDKDYTQEPEKTFDELAIERCNYLRGTSDWLCLWLSSGYDSNTILDYFILTGNKIDEIIIYRRAKWDPEYRWANTRAHEYKKTHNPNLKITYWQIPVEHHLDAYRTFKDDWIMQTSLNGKFSRSNLTWNIEFGGLGMQALDYKSQNRIDINGFDKPRLTVYENSWYAMFPDNAVVDIYHNRFTGFFIDTECFDLYLKSLYQITRWFESLHDFSPELVHVVQSHKKYYREWNLASGRFPEVSAYSEHGFGKGMFNHSSRSRDGMPYLDEFADTDSVRYYFQGLERISNVCDWFSIGDDLAVKSMCLSEMKYIKDVDC